MRKVMIRESDRNLLRLFGVGNLLQSVPYFTLVKKLFAKPNRNGFMKGDESAWRESIIGFQQTLEFEQRLIIECNGIHILQLDVGKF